MVGYYNTHSFFLTYDQLIWPRKALFFKVTQPPHLIICCLTSRLLFIAAANFHLLQGQRIILVKLSKLALKSSNPDAEKLSREKIFFWGRGYG